MFNHLSISSLITGNPSNQISELKNFSKSQKEWFVTASFSIINCDEKFTVSNAFLRIMDISNEEVVQIVSKVN